MCCKKSHCDDRQHCDDESSQSDHDIDASKAIKFAMWYVAVLIYLLLKLRGSAKGISLKDGGPQAIQMKLVGTSRLTVTGRIADGSAQASDGLNEYEDRGTRWI